MKNIIFILTTILMFGISSCKKEVYRPSLSRATVSFAQNGATTKYQTIYSFRLNVSDSIPEDSTAIGCPHSVQVVVNEPYVFKYKNAFGEYKNLWGVEEGFHFKFYTNTNFGAPQYCIDYQQFGEMGMYLVTDSTQCISSNFTFKARFP